jgi:hypothetical protein
MEFVLNETDTLIWERELRDFIPDKIFDFHCHIFDAGELAPESIPAHYRSLGCYDITSQKKYNAALFPGIKFDCLVTGWPNEAAGLKRQNDFLFSESRKGGGPHMLLLVRPEMDRDYIEAQIDKTGAAGFKPYKCFSKAEPENSRIVDYLPEEQIEIADRCNLIITLHLSRKKGIADENNFEELLELSDRYPGVIWNLAHCGRSFIPEFLEADIPEFGELKKRKVYFDISAVTDAEVMLIIIEGMGAERVLYGSDSPVGLMRGKCAGFGYDWMFVAEDKFDFRKLRESFGVIEPTFVLYEQLRALKRACKRAGLTKGQVEDIFYYNAKKLFARGNKRNSQ